MLNTIKSAISLIPREYRLNFIFLLFLSLVSVALEALSISLFVPFMSHLTGSDEITSGYFFYILNLLKISNYFGFGHFFENESIKILFSIVVLFLIRTFIQAYFIIKNAKLTYGIELTLSKNIFKVYLNKDYDFFLKNNPSYLLRNIMTETNKFSSGVLASIISIFTESFIVFALLILGFIANKFFSISAFFFFIFFGSLFYIVTKNKIINYGKVRFEADGKKMKHVQEGLMSVVEIKLMNIADIFINFFVKHAKDSYNINIRYTFLTHLPKIMFELIFVVTIFFLFLLLFYFNFSEQNILNLIAVFAILSIRLIPSIAKLLSNIQSFNFSKKSIDVLREINLYEKKINIDLQENNLSKNKKIDFKKVIKLSGISFSYKDEEGTKKEIVNDLNFEINKNDKIGIFGGSGIGKTTLLKVLISLIKPDKGQISIDGVDLNEKNIESWHSKIGYVSQNTTILDESLVFNIALSNSEIDYDHLKKLLEKLNLNRFINKDNQIQNFNMGDKGSKISGGEKQRIGICRALYKRPKVLILDEPTSSLDELNENKIIKDIFDLKDITIILVSHNLENFKYCNQTYELVGKKLKELK